MKLSHSLLVAVTVAAATLFVAPASAADHGDGNNSSSGGNNGSSGGNNGSSGGGDPTPVPEPSDAILLLMGATGVVIGRQLHARVQREG